MKTLYALSLLAVIPWLAAAQTVVPGETKVVSGPVSTGKVIALDKTAGTMQVRSEQTAQPITFYGLQVAKVETSTGRAVPFAEVAMETPVTVHYSVRDGRWFVAKVVIPETNPVTTPEVVTLPLTGAEIKALNSKAAQDGDITTKPGVKARIDGDITTKPGKKDPADPDITKKSENR